MIHLLLHQLRPCYDFVLLCCTVNSYILYVCTYMCGSLYMRICVLEFCGYYIRASFFCFYHICNSYETEAALLCDPHSECYNIILFGQLHPNRHLVSQKFISAVIPLLSSLVRLGYWKNTLNIPYSRKIWLAIYLVNTPILAFGKLPETMMQSSP